MPSVQEWANWARAGCKRWAGRALPRAQRVAHPSTAARGSRFGRDPRSCTPCTSAAGRRLRAGGVRVGRGAREASAGWHAGGAGRAREPGMRRATASSCPLSCRLPALNAPRPKRGAAPPRALLPPATALTSTYKPAQGASGAILAVWWARQRFRSRERCLRAFSASSTRAASLHVRCGGVFARRRGVRCMPRTDIHGARPRARTPLAQ